MGTVALYSYTGAWRGINELATDHASDQSLRVSLPALAAAAETAPKSLQAREAYARALGKAGQHAKAAEEFRAAVLLSGGRPDLILDFATAQILSKDGTITEEANKSVDMVLLMAPREPKARFFKAVYLQQQGDIAQAKQKMTEILADIPASDALYATIQARLKSMDMPQ